MYLKKEIIISIFIISISSSNLYMPMIWLYVFQMDVLIPFLCDPGLQCKILDKLKKVILCIFSVCVQKEDGNHACILTSEKKKKKKHKIREGKYLRGNVVSMH